MDWVSGELLIYQVRDHPDIEKKILFGWIRQLLMQLMQYHRCHNNQNYRYLNPYSVLVTKEGKVLLLDLEAESNEFVLRNLQKRAMRAHFVKPVVHIMEGAGEQLDLYGYGKTIQFILANTNVEPSLTKYQENRLEKIINKCLNESKGKNYKELRQIEKELPVIRAERLWAEKKYLIPAVAAGISVIVAAGSLSISQKVMLEQKSLQNWIWELEQQQEENRENIDSEELELRMENTEKGLREEIALTKEQIKAVNESLEQYINEEKRKEELEQVGQSAEDEANSTGEAENVEEMENLAEEAGAEVPAEEITP